MRQRPLKRVPIISSPCWKTRSPAQEFATLAISGGSTPKLMFQMLAAAPLHWDKVHLFWVDERCVPPTDDASNLQTRQRLPDCPAHIPAAHVHRIAGELKPEAAARRYADEIRDFFGLDEGEMPHFDVVHRGMGPDAHTASLFPGDPLIDDREGIAGSTYVEEVQAVARHAAAGSAAGRQAYRLSGGGSRQAGGAARGVRGGIRPQEVSRADRCASRPGSDLVFG